MRPNQSQVGCTELVYDGFRISDTFQVVDLSIPVLPGIEAVSHELAQRPGAYFVARKVGTRQVKVRLRLDAASRNPTVIFDEWRQVSHNLAKTEPKKLYVGTDTYMNALLVGDSVIEDNAYYGEVELTFVCFDPYIHGPAHSVQLSNLSAKTFNVEGNAPGFPIATGTATRESVTVRNVTTNQYVTIPSAGSGTTVVVDMAKQLATVNGSFAPVNLESDFFGIEGTVAVRFEGMSGTLDYEELYL